jgi:ferredoxin
MVGDLNAIGQVSVDQLADVRLSVRRPPKLDTVAEVLKVLCKVCALCRLACPVCALRRVGTCDTSVTISG